MRGARRVVGTPGGRWVPGRIVTVLLVALVATTLAPAPAVAAPAGGGDDQAAARQEAARARARAAVDGAVERVRDARRALTGAVADYHGARTAARGAEAGVKQVEERVVALAVTWRQAFRHEQRVAASLRRAVAAEAPAERRVERERAGLWQQAAEVYKAGTVRRSSMTLELVRTAPDPNVLARELHMLESVVGSRVHDYREARDRLREIRRQITRLRAERDRAAAATGRADRDLRAAEAAAHAARARSDAAEASIVAALTARVRATAEIPRAEAALAAVVARTPADAGVDPAAARRTAAADTPAADDGRAPTAAQAAARSASLARSRGLSLDDQAVRRRAVCPVDGASFTNDFHFDRHPFRRHEGTDLFAPRGTAIHAPAAGVVAALDATDGGDLGGITVSLETPSGDRWYLAHLQSIAPGLRVGEPLAAGDVVGTVGTSGNARGTPPHLHIGLYRTGGSGRAAVNPYPTLAAACADAEQADQAADGPAADPLAALRAVLGPPPADRRI